MRKSIYTEKQKSFCAALREARLKAGLTQADVAKRLKKPQSFVSKYEGGERSLDFIEFLEVADAIELDPRAMIATVKGVGLAYEQL